VNKRSFDLGLGVKSQSNPVIANSYRNWSESSLGRDNKGGIDTDLGFRVGNYSALCPTQNAFIS